MIQPLWRTVWRFLKKLKIELPYDAAIPLLGINPEVTIIRKDTCTPMFIAALFTIVEARNNLNVHIYNGILLIHKKNEIIPLAATWMDLEIIILSEVSQTEKDKYNMISLIRGI